MIENRTERTIEMVIETANTGRSTGYVHMYIYI